MCSVPPTRYPRSRERLNVSATTPSPGNAASPCITHGQDARVILPDCLALQRARRALQHRIHELEVARIRDAADCAPCHRRRARASARAEMVLHVAGDARRVASACRRIRRIDCPTGFSRTCASTLMRPRCAMAITTSRAPRAAALVDRRVEHRHERVGALDREALVALIRAAEESLEAVDLREAAQQRELFVRPERAAHRAALDLLAEPEALVLFFNVLELESDARRVERAQMLDHIGRGAKLVEAERGAGDRGEVGGGESVERRRQLGSAGRRTAERIERDLEVPVLAYRMHERRGAGDFAQVRRIERRGRARRGGRTAGERERHLEILAPRIVDRCGIAAIPLVHLGDVAVVERTRDRARAHGCNLTREGMANEGDPAMTGGLRAPPAAPGCAG